MRTFISSVKYMDQRKMLMREVLDYVHSAGLVVKKVGFDVLKASRKWYEVGQGDPTKANYAATKKFRESRMASKLRQDLMSYTNNSELKTYIDEVLDGQPWSKSPSLFLFFTTQDGQHQKKPVHLAGLAVTGTFNPYRDSVEYKSSTPTVKFDAKVADLEIVVATPNLCMGKAITLWALADVLSKKAQGQAKYTRVVSVSSNHRMRRILEQCKFQWKPCRVLEEGQPVQHLTNDNTSNHEQLMYLDATSQKVQSIRTMLREDRPGLADRPGLYDICPPGGPALGGTRGWQLCR